MAKYTQNLQQQGFCNDLIKCLGERLHEEEHKQAVACGSVESRIDMGTNRIAKCVSQMRASGQSFFN